jgi:hypothetical protein
MKPMPRNEDSGKWSFDKAERFGDLGASRPGEERTGGPSLAGDEGWQIQRLGGLRREQNQKHEQQPDASSYGRSSTPGGFGDGEPKN